MKQIYWVLIVVITYVILINIVSVAVTIDVSSPSNIPNQQIVDSGSNQRLGVSDSITIDIARKRWYGVIYEKVGYNDTESNFYLFNIVKFPVRVGGISFITIHLIFISMIALWFLILWFIKLESKQQQKGGVTNEQVS